MLSEVVKRMPDNAQRDANIARLFEKLDYVADKVTSTQNEVSAIGVKVDDFSARLKRLEERDEKHLEKEEKLELLAVRMETIIDKGEDTMKELDKRMSTIETDVDSMKADINNLKKNWKILTGVITAVGSGIGYLIKTVLDFLK